MISKETKLIFYCTAFLMCSALFLQRVLEHQYGWMCVGIGFAASLWLAKIILTTIELLKGG